MRASGRSEAQRIGVVGTALVDAQPFRAPREDFPILQQPVNGRPLVWLDTAATAQKPRAVLDAMRTFCETRYANVHRGVHTLGHAATQPTKKHGYRWAEFIGAGGADEVIFVRGATEAINLVAASFGRSTISAGDEVVVTELEHHSNIVPWQCCVKRLARC